MSSLAYASAQLHGNGQTRPNRQNYTQSLQSRFHMIVDPFSLLLVLLGPFVGSFLAVLADRLPRGESVVLARSHCRSCHFDLPFRDLIPIWSYVMRRGKCRFCGASIPPWLLYTEIAATGIAILSVLANSDPVLAWLDAVFLWLLLTLAVTDLTRFRLPDLLNGILLAVAMLLSLLPGGIGPEAALIGVLAGVGSFWALRFAYHRLRGVEGLGLGDVKLMAGLGAYAGPLDLPLLVLLAALAGLTGGLIFHLTGRARSDAPPLGKRALPFGASLCGAAAVLWFLRVMAWWP